MHVEMSTKKRITMLLGESWTWGAKLGGRLLPEYLLHFIPCKYIAFSK